MDFLSIVVSRRKPETEPMTKPRNLTPQEFNAKCSTLVKARRMLDHTAWVRDWEIDMTDNGAISGEARVPEEMVGTLMQVLRGIGLRVERDYCPRNAPVQTDGGHVSKEAVITISER